MSSSRPLSDAADALTRDLGPTWMDRLFAQVIADGMKDSCERRQRYNAGTHEVPVRPLPYIEDFHEWTTTRLSEFEAFGYRLAAVINSQLPEAFAAADTTPDGADDVVAAAQAIVVIYEDCLDWSEGVRCALGEEWCRPVVEALAYFPHDILELIESLGEPRLQELDASAAQGQSISHSVSLPPLVVTFQPRFGAALDALAGSIDAGETQVRHRPG